jgi:hypothetical protein
MFVRYQGNDFYGLLTNHKNFIWLIYDNFQLEKTNVSIIPSWLDSNGVINSNNEILPEVIFIESMYSEVRDEVAELGYDLYSDVYDGGLWDNNNDVQRPLIVGFKNGWKMIDSIGECYCTETITRIIFSVYPNELENYLNQPV